MSDIYPDWWHANRLPSSSGVPMQQPGGTPEEAAKANLELAKQSAAQEQARNYRLWTGGQDMAAQLHNLGNAYDNADAQHLNVFASGLLSQVQGKGAGKIPFFGTDLAHTSRLQQIDTGFGNPDLAQREETAADRIDALQTDLALKRQAYARVTRGGGQTEANSTGDETQGSVGRGNIAMIRQMVGLRSESTLPGLRAKLQEGWNDVFAGMGEAIQNDPKNYTVDGAIKILSPFGFSRDQIKQGLLNRSHPDALPPAGGARDANRGGATPPAAGPHSGVNVDQEGEAPPPAKPPGRLRPQIQAGVGPAGQASGDATNRLNMERMEPGVQIPEMPKQFNPARAFQYERAVQILQQHPELADNGEWDKRFAPNFPGTAKQLLRKMQAQGAPQ